jgi:hypothetical protein
VSISNAKKLIDAASAEPNRLQRHLLVAAALHAALPVEPVVVGGTAEEYWTSDEYHQTDLDLCAPIGKAERESLRRLGFRKSGRHWENPRLRVAVEFPESELDGDFARTELVAVGSGAARMIGREDLYIDRVLQATADSGESVRSRSALAIAVANYEEMDWPYVAARLRETTRRDAALGLAARKIDSKARRRARLQLSS